MKTTNQEQHHDEVEVLAHSPFHQSRDPHELFYQTEEDQDGNSLRYDCEVEMEDHQFRLEPPSGRERVLETLAGMDSLALKPTTSTALEENQASFVDDASALSILRTGESDSENGDGKWIHQTERRRRMLGSVICLGLLALIVVLSVVLPGNGSKVDGASEGVITQVEEEVEEGEPPSPAPTPSPSRAVEQSLEFQTISPWVDDEALLLDPTTPQGQALDAIIAEGHTVPSTMLQRFALMVLYFSTDGPNWDYIHGWNGFLSNECLWYGVETCRYQENTGLMAVSNIGLEGNLLDGTIPKEICILENLERIIISDNTLRGNLPSCLASLPELIELNVKNNGLTGMLPAGLFMAPSLEFLTLSENAFTGDLARLFDDYDGGAYPAFYQLERLNLDHNMFSSQVPSQLMFLQKLEELTLEHNAMTGTVDAICNTRTIELFTVDCAIECKCCNTCSPSV